MHVNAYALFSIVGLASSVGAHAAIAVLTLGRESHGVPSAALVSSRRLHATASLCRQHFYTK